MAILDPEGMVAILVTSVDSDSNRRSRNVSTSKPRALTCKKTKHFLEKPFPQKSFAFPRFHLQQSFLAVLRDVNQRSIHSIKDEPNPRPRDGQMLGRGPLSQDQTARSICDAKNKVEWVLQAHASRSRGIERTKQ